MIDNYWLTTAFIEISINFREIVYNCTQYGSVARYGPQSVASASGVFHYGSPKSTIVEFTWMKNWSQRAPRVSTANNSISQFQRTRRTTNLAITYATRRCEQVWNSLEREEKRRDERNGWERARRNFCSLRDRSSFQRPGYRNRLPVIDASNPLLSMSLVFLWHSVSFVARHFFACPAFPTQRFHLRRAPPKRRLFTSFSRIYRVSLTCKCNYP